MTEEEAAAVLTAALRELAPEADPGAGPDLPLQEVADIDSMDFLRLVTIIRDRTGVDIPARDYPRLATLRLFAAYLAASTSG